MEDSGALRVVAPEADGCSPLPGEGAQEALFVQVVQPQAEAEVAPPRRGQGVFAEAVVGECAGDDGE